MGVVGGHVLARHGRYLEACPCRPLTGRWTASEWSAEGKRRAKLFAAALNRAELARTHARDGRRIAEVGDRLASGRNTYTEGVAKRCGRRAVAFDNGGVVVAAGSLRCGGINHRADENIAIHRTHRHVELVETLWIPHSRALLDGFFAF